MKMMLKARAASVSGARGSWAAWFRAGWFGAPWFRAGWFGAGWRRALRRGFAHPGQGSRGLALLFSLAWAATLAPLWPHQTPTLWLWGALCGAVLALSAWLHARLARQAVAALALTGCVALIGLATLVDFWRLPPVFILAQCRSGAGAGLAADVLRHVETHWRWFPVTTVSMLLWVGFGPHAGTRAAARLGSALLMLTCMGLAMSCFETLARKMGVAMSADGLVSAMLAGMGLHHVLLALPGCWPAGAGRLSPGRVSPGKQGG